MNGDKPNLEPGIYAAAVAAFCVTLLPYANVFIITAYVTGALVGVWYLTRKRGQTIGYKDGAKVGFLGVGAGVLAASIVVDLIWQFAEYQLWQKQNATLMVAVCRSFMSPSTVDTMTIAMEQNAEKPFVWYIFLFQLIGTAIFSSLFAAPAGMLGVKLFGGRRPNSINTAG